MNPEASRCITVHHGSVTPASRGVTPVTNHTDTDTDNYSQGEIDLRGVGLPSGGNTTSEGSTGIVPRPFQVDAVNGLRNLIREGNRTLVLQAPTGAGKTVIASEIIRGAEEKGSNVLFFAHRRELVYQCSDKLHRMGVDHGIIMAGEYPVARHVQVASINTLWARRHKEPLPPAKLLVVDECHRSLAPTYQALIKHYYDQGAVVFGLSATPARSDGTGLGDIYQAMHQCPSIKELTDMGYLVPLRFFAPSKPDLNGVRVKMGDYVESELEDRVDKPKIVGDIVTHWSQYARNRKTVVFASGVRHSLHIRDAFREAGVACEHIDGSTDRGERDTILEGLNRGHIQVVTNCNVLTEGWDQPDVSCCVLARPTKSLILYMQMVGRVMRSFEGKEDALVMDHAGIVHEHGFPADITEWHLKPGRPNVNTKHQERKKGRTEDGQRICSECSFVTPAQGPCRSCGALPKKKGENIEVVDGELGEVEKAGSVKKPQWTEAQKLEFYRQLKGQAQLSGYKMGWAAHAYKEKFGNWPPKSWKYESAQQPSEVVSNYTRFLRIRNAKSMQRRAS